ALVVNDLDGGREIGDKTVWVGVKTNDDGIGEKLSQFVIVSIGVKNPTVDLRKEILLEPADRLSGTKNGALDALRIELNQGAVALLYFNDPVLDGHEEIVLWKLKGGEGRTEERPDIVGD